MGKVEEDGDDGAVGGGEGKSSKEGVGGGEGVAGSAYARRVTTKKGKRKYETYLIAAVGKCESKR